MPFLFCFLDISNSTNQCLTWKWSHKIMKRIIPTTKIFSFNVVELYCHFRRVMMCILAPRCQLWQVLEIIPFVQQFRHLSVRNNLSHNMMTEDFPTSFKEKSFEEIAQTKKKRYKCAKAISALQCKTKCSWKLAISYYNSHLTRA